MVCFGELSKLDGYTARAARSRSWKAGDVESRLVRRSSAGGGRLLTLKNEFGACSRRRGVYVDEDFFSRHHPRLRAGPRIARLSTRPTVKT